MKNKNLAIGLSFFTTFGIFTYWISVFTGIFPVVDLIPGYTDWFMAFPLADAWIGVTAFLGGYFLLKGKDTANPFGIAAGSGLIFLGLYAFLYGFNTGLLFLQTMDEYIEIAIKIYALSVGSFFISFYWKARKVL
ncbi:MAG: hypothetical protein HN736_13360 [Anaerolineae bacterium]|jgi:hypothetical protein|nr:hypothetical protein [Anaerolineae bacterium]MBT3714639.1 hypothetical protein [Anaerolineae bacterium]MBT4311161.1 hypothetical protein [Anaerolineae bacterium]MBT4458033.1 hypothetical protein [Anaerolineae bacterium]MBT4843696.1 hypothetical protein [Anaerolineae bacterium]